MLDPTWNLQFQPVNNTQFLNRGKSEADATRVSQRTIMEQYSSEASPPFPWYCPLLPVKLSCFGNGESEDYTIEGKDENAICRINWGVISNIPLSSRARLLVICVSIQAYASAVRLTTSPKLRERRKCDLKCDLVEIVKLHMIPWGRPEV